MQADPYITSFINPANIYPQHIANFADPVFPCITLDREGLGGDPDLSALDNSMLQIDVWSKKSALEAAQIYRNRDPITNRRVGIRSLFHNVRRANGVTCFPEVGIDVLTEVYSASNGYDGTYHTYRFSARYNMKLSANNVTIL